MSEQVAWQQVDTDWWRSELGYVRRVYNGRTAYVSWRHLEPPSGYFPFIDQAKKYVEDAKSSVQK